MTIILLSVYAVSLHRSSKAAQIFYRGLNGHKIFRLRFLETLVFTPGKAVQCSRQCRQCAGWCPRLNSSCLKLIWLAPVNQRDGCGVISGCGGLTRHCSSGLQFGIYVHWYSIASFSSLKVPTSAFTLFRIHQDLILNWHHLSTWNRDSCPQNLYGQVVWIVKTLKTLSMYIDVTIGELWTLEMPGRASRTRNTGAAGRGRG